MSPAWYRQRLDGGGWALDTRQPGPSPGHGLGSFCVLQPVQWCSGGWRPAPVRYQDPCHQQQSVERSAHHVPHHVPHPPASATPSRAAVLTRAVWRNIQSPRSLAGTELGPRGPASRRKLQFWCWGCWGCASLQTTRAKNIAKSGSQTSASRGAGDRHWEGSSIFTSIHLHNNRYR